MKNGTRALILSLTAEVLAGCAPRPATAIVLRIDTDLTRERELRSVQVRVTREGGGRALVDQTFDLSGGRLPLPGEITLVPRDRGDARLVQVEVLSRVGITTEQLVTQRATATFSPDLTTVLEIQVARRCLTTTCAAGMSCDRAGCVPIDRDPLPELEDAGN